MRPALQQLHPSPADLSPSFTASLLPPHSDDIDGDQRLPHDSGEEVTFDQLKAIGALPYPGIELDQVEAMCVRPLSSSPCPPRAHELT